jgi:hypothetical protein
MENKICTRCGDDKSLDEYRIQTANGYKYHKSVCRLCEREINRVYRENNKEKEAKRLKDYRNNNRDKRLEYELNYRENNKDSINSYQKIYYSENKEIISKRQRIYETERRKTEPIFKLTGNIRNMIRKALKSNGYSKKSQTHNILGCSFENFKTYIESLWEPWMNWGNHGLYNSTKGYGWDVDHIIPLASAKTEDDITRLCHFSNLQPLCSKINRDIKRHK